MPPQSREAEPTSFPLPMRDWGKPPSLSGEADLPKARKEFGGLDQPSRPREETGTDSLGGVPTTGRVECPPAPAHSGGVSRGGAGRRWARPPLRQWGGSEGGGGGEEKSARLAGTCSPLPPPPKGIRTGGPTPARGTRPQGVRPAQCSLPGPGPHRARDAPTSVPAGHGGPRGGASAPPPQHPGPPPSPRDPWSRARSLEKGKPAAEPREVYGEAERARAASRRAFGPIAHLLRGRCPAAAPAAPAPARGRAARAGPAAARSVPGRSRRRRSWGTNPGSPEEPSPPPPPPSPF